MQLRDATAGDVDAIARLHADSWRRNYRGSYSDEFLDGAVVEDRRTVWTERLVQPTPNRCTIVAEQEGAVVGFVHVVLDADPTWGALLDNLHVSHELKRSGIGAQLMAAGATAVLERAPSPRLYLWVLEPNTAAQAFYEACGGTRVGREERRSPAGDPVVAFRYAWPDASVLLPVG
jgi:ribosomal protein S18 acetylase RimI-like enzyme